MRKPKLNRTREQRFIDEVVVDAYTSDERAMGWYYYLEGKIEFPFNARCVAVRSVSPLKKPEHGLVRGQVGTIVEELPPDAYEVEFCNDQGRTYASTGIPPDKLIVLRYQRIEAVGVHFQ